jgi:hypothetical protein
MSALWQLARAPTPTQGTLDFCLIVDCDCPPQSSSRHPEAPAWSGASPVPFCTLLTRQPPDRGTNAAKKGPDPLVVASASQSPRKTQ